MRPSWESIGLSRHGVLGGYSSTTLGLHSCYFRRVLLQNAQKKKSFFYSIKVSQSENVIYGLPSPPLTLKRCGSATSLSEVESRSWLVQPGQGPQSMTSFSIPLALSLFPFPNPCYFHFLNVTNSGVELGMMMRLKN